MFVYRTRSGFVVLAWVKTMGVAFRLTLVCSIFCLIILLRRNGCATSEDLFWKLDALQAFIRDLHWPNPEFGNHLEQRLKLMACDMIESCIQRTESAFQSWLKKGVTFVSTDYIIPTGESHNKIISFRDGQ